MVAKIMGRSNSFDQRCLCYHDAMWVMHETRPFIPINALARPQNSSVQHPANQVPSPWQGLGAALSWPQLLRRFSFWRDCSTRQQNLFLPVLKVEDIEWWISCQRKAAEDIKVSCRLISAECNKLFAEPSISRNRFEKMMFGRILTSRKSVCPTRSTQFPTRVHFFIVSVYSLGIEMTSSWMLKYDRHQARLVKSMSSVHFLSISLIIHWPPPCL